MKINKSAANKSRLWISISTLSSLAVLLAMLLINAYFLNTADDFFKNRSLLLIVTLMSLVSVFLSIVATFKVHGPKRKSVTLLSAVFSIGLSLYTYIQASWEVAGW